MSKADFETLAHFRYQLRRFLRFSEEVTRRKGVTPLQYLLMLQIKGFPGREWSTVGELAERCRRSITGSCCCRSLSTYDRAQVRNPANMSANGFVWIGVNMIKIKRVYDKPARTDGYRVLVDRLWPRGVARASLPLGTWLKEAAPSDELRRWFKHDPARWPEFQRRYRLELEAHPDSWASILVGARRGNVTLLYSAHDVEHNNAVVLRDFLNAKLKEVS